MVRKAALICAAVLLGAWAVAGAKVSLRERLAANRALRAALEVLPESLRAKDEQAHWRWLEVIGVPRREELVRALIQVSRSRYPEVRAQALRQLGAAGGAEAIARLVEAAADKEWEVRAAALSALLLADPRAAVEAARRRAGDSSTTVLSRCLLILRERAPEEALRLAAEKLRDKRATVRWIAAKSLALSGAAGAPALARALATERGEMKDAADVWRDAGDILAFEHVWYPRALIAYALGELGYREAVPALREAARDGVAVVALEALNALVKLDPEAAKEACLEAGKREKLGGAPFVILSRANKDAARQGARAAAESKSLALRRCGLRALAQIGDPRDWPLLARALEETNRELALAVLEGLDPGWLWVDAGRADFVLVADYGRAHPGGLHYPVERYRGGGGLHPDRRWPRRSDAPRNNPPTGKSAAAWRRMHQAVQGYATGPAARELRWYALRALRCFFRTAEDAQTLAAVAAQESDRYLAIEALRGLGEIGGAEQAEAVLAALRQGAHMAIRRAAARALLAIAPERAPAELLRAAAKEKERMTRALLISLAGEAAAKASPAERGELVRLLEPLLEHEDRLTRSAAAVALGSVGGSRAVELLARAAQRTVGGDQAAQVRFAPERTTLRFWFYFGTTSGQLNNYKYYYRVANEYSTTLSCPGPSARALGPDDLEIGEGCAPAVLALGALGSAEAGRALAKLCAHANPTIRRDAVIALAANPAAEGDEAIVRALDDPRVEVRRAAAAVLPQAQVGEALERLREVINNKAEDRGVRIAAAQSIVRLVAELDARLAAERGEAQ